MERSRAFQLKPIARMEWLFLPSTVSEPYRFKGSLDSKITRLSAVCCLDPPKAV